VRNNSRAKNYSRLDRVNEAIQNELSLIFRELKDPRIDLFTSVMSVDTSRDLKYCTVYVSVMGDDQKKTDAFAALNSGKAFIRHELAERVNLRITPELTFKLDDSVEYGIHMDELLKGLETSVNDQN